MRRSVFFAAALTLVLSACDNRLTGGETVRGTPAQLTYAAPGTKIRLVNDSNGTKSESNISAARRPACAAPTPPMMAGSAAFIPVAGAAAMA